jgi:hypothetical protein
MGAAPSSRTLGPFHDMSWEIWACSPPNYDLPRVDAWFEVHSLRRKMTPQNEPFFNVLKKHPRVYLNGADPLKNMIPNHIDYPIDYMVAKHGRWFFSSSLAYMMALAIEQKPEVIGLWGVDMSATEEYGYQRAGCHYFIKYAADHDINVIAPPESDILCPHPLYGFKEQSPMFWKQRVREKELKDRIAKAEHTVNSANQEIMVLRGAIDDLNYINNTYDPLRFSEHDVKPVVKADE